MPTQDPNQNNQNLGTAPIAVSDSSQTATLSSMPTHTDLPPLPDFMATPDKTPSDMSGQSQSTSNTPQDDSSQVATAAIPAVGVNVVEDSSGSGVSSDLPPIVSTPKKKFGGGKVFATILGIFLLVGGLGAGLILTQQQQLFNQKAAGTDYSGYYQCGPNGSEWCHVFTGTLLGSVPCADGSANDCISQCQGGNASACTQLCGAAGAGEETCAPPGTGCTTAPVNGAGVSCNDWHFTHCIGGGTQGVGCGTGGTGCTGDNCGSSNTPTPTPPGTTAACENINAYDSSWAALTPTQLSALAVGTSVNFCAVGSASSGSFDMARFTINGVLQANTTTKGSGAAVNDYCQSYTIPASVTTFNIKAELHHTTLGWF